MLIDRTSQLLNEAWKEIVKLAKAGKLEIDEGAVVSKSDDPGAYVMAWLWVSDDPEGDDDEDADDGDDKPDEMKGVVCVLCRSEVLARTAHLDRDGDFVCEHCWDERLR